MKIQTRFASPPSWPVSGLSSIIVLPSHANTVAVKNDLSQHLRRLITVAGAARVDLRKPRVSRLTADKNMSAGTRIGAIVGAVPARRNAAGLRWSIIAPSLSTFIPC